MGVGAGFCVYKYDVVVKSSRSLSHLPMRSSALIASRKIPAGSISFYSAPQCSHCKRCISYGNFLRPSVRTRHYCVKTTALSTVQFALLDSKMCLVL